MGTGDSRGRAGLRVALARSPERRAPAGAPIQRLERGGMPPHPSMRRSGPGQGMPPHPALQHESIQRSELPRPKLPFRLGDTKAAPKKAVKVVKRAAPIEVMEAYNLAIQGSDTFRSWIKYWVRVVATEALGRALLSEFADTVTHSFTWKTKKVTVAINEKTVDSDQPVRTGSFNGWHELGDAQGRPKWGNEVPLISIASPDLVSTRAGNLTLTGTGRVLNHPDCHGMDLDVALFHELCHAYYWQVGATKDLQAVGTTPLVGLFQGGGMRVDAKENTEEQIVSGLWAGKGLTYCENSYRAGAGLPPRTQYSAPSVGIVDQDLVRIAGKKDWAKTWDTWRAGASVSNVFTANGYTALAAVY